jgi:nucleoside-diphosphate-sugar epimerase
MEKILATGISGTIGSKLPKSVLPLILDLSEEFTQDSELTNAKAVIHLAGVVGNVNVLKDPDYAYKVNVIGTMNLAKMIANYTDAKFIYVSSSHVYKKSLTKHLESSDVEPISVYAEQKARGEQEVIEIFKNCPERLIIIRVFSLLDWTLPDFTLGGMARKIYTAQSQNKIKFSDDVRDFLSSRDVANGIYKISADKYVSGIINLCTGKEKSVGSAIEEMFSHTNFEGIKPLLEPGNSETPYIVGDNSKLLNLFPDQNLNWDSKFGVEALPHP